MDICEHWLNLIDKSGRTPADLSTAIGKHRSYLSKLLSGKRFEPGAFTAQRLASELRVSMEHLLGRDESLSVSADPDYRQEVHRQASNVLADVMRVTHERLRSSQYTSADTDMMGALLQWWHKQGGVLSGHEVFESRFDVINVPDPTSLEVMPERIGAETLAAQQLGTNDPHALTQLIRSFDTETRRELGEAFLDVSKTGVPHLTPVLSISIPLGGEHHHTFEYFSLRLPVRTPSGDRFILSHCFDV